MRTNQLQKSISTKWFEKELGEVASFFNGKAHENDISNNGKYVVINSKFVSTNGSVAKYTDTCFSPLKKGDVAMVMSDVPNGKAIAKCFLVDEDNKYTLNQRIGGFRSSEISSSFLYYLLNRNRYFLAFDDGVNQTNLRKDDILECPLYFPPLPEQNRIVAVLETWDRAIDKLAKKIETKKVVKKGLMQELLTGKTRLPEFKNKWQQIKLGSIGKLISGGTPSKLQDQYWIGEVPWISSSDLIEDDIKYVNIHRYITHEAVKGSATSIIPKKSVVVVSRVGVGKVIVNEEVLCTSQDFQSLVVDKNQNNPYFFAHLLIVELQKLLLSNQGTSIRGFLKKDLEALSLRVPEIEEQTSIANILTTADNEIRQIKQKLSLLTDQKKYLLNNLITGVIRTPKTLSTRG